MSDLDNGNLTNEEENSGFSPSDSDNKSFSADKGSSANPTANNDWGQSNYFVKPRRKMPLWPFLLVGAFVLLGIIAIIIFSKTSYQSVTISEYDNGKYHPKSQAHIFHRTQQIAIDKKMIVEVHKKGISDDNNGKYDPHHYKAMGKCDPNGSNPDGKCVPNHKFKHGECKPIGKCNPNDCKPSGKCDPKDCQPGGKCDPKDCKPMRKCDTKDCQPGGKCEPKDCKPMYNITPKYTTKPLKIGTTPKLGKPALQDNATGLYVLQVYAALSKEDADAKYEEYKSKGVEKVWVSTFTKANIVWYRVRIGDFTTIAAADSKAKELGISTYWVDKIR